MTVMTMDTQPTPQSFICLQNKKKKFFQREVKLVAPVSPETSQKPSLKRMLSSHQPSTQTAANISENHRPLGGLAVSNQADLTPIQLLTGPLFNTGRLMFNCSDTLQALQALCDTACVCVSESLGPLPPALLRHKSCLLMTTSSIGPEAGVKAHQLSE